MLPDDETSKRLRALDTRHRRSYEILNEARDLAEKTSRYDSQAVRRTMSDGFYENTGGKRPHEWQLDVAEALYLKIDCTIIAGTGRGKTIPYMLLSYLPDNSEKMTAIISPLKNLQREQVSH